MITSVAIDKTNTKELFSGKISKLTNARFFFTKSAFTENLIYRHPTAFVKMSHTHIYIYIILNIKTNNIFRYIIYHLITI